MISRVEYPIRASVIEVLDMLEKEIKNIPSRTIRIRTPSVRDVHIDFDYSRENYLLTISTKVSIQADKNSQKYYFDNPDGKGSDVIKFEITPISNLNLSLTGYYVSNNSLYLSLFWEQMVKLGKSVHANWINEAINEFEQAQQKSNFEKDFEDWNDEAINYRKVELWTHSFDILDTTLSRSLEYYKLKFNKLLIRRTTQAAAMVEYHLDWEIGLENPPIYLGSIDLRKIQPDVTEVILQRLHSGQYKEQYESAIKYWKSLIEFDIEVAEGVRARKRKEDYSTSLNSVQSLGATCEKQDSSIQSVPLEEPPKKPEPIKSEIPKNIFSKTGNVWEIAFQGCNKFYLENLVGLFYIYQLLRNPNKAIRVTALESRNADGTFGDLQDIDLEDDLYVDSGSSDVIMDSSYKKDIQNRLHTLSDDRLDAEAKGDSNRLIEIEDETEKIKKELASISGLGGRSRSIPGEDEKSRQRVTQAIKLAIKKIDSDGKCPDLAKYFDKYICTGLMCKYAPPTEPVIYDWILDVKQ